MVRLAGGNYKIPHTSKEFKLVQKYAVKALPTAQTASVQQVKGLNPGKCRGCSQ